MFIFINTSYIVKSRFQGKYYKVKYNKSNRNCNERDTWRNRCTVDTVGCKSCNAK